MTRDEKERSRQKQMWFSTISITLIVILVFIMVWFDKDVSKGEVIISSVALALAGKEGVNLYTTPKGDD